MLKYFLTSKELNQNIEGDVIGQKISISLVFGSMSQCLTDILLMGFIENKDNHVLHQKMIITHQSISSRYDIKMAPLLSNPYDFWITPTFKR